MTIYFIPIIVGLLACWPLGIHPLKMLGAFALLALWILTITCLKP